MLVGAYGSGKTEVAVNLAIRWAQEGRRVQMADLDLVNPYFRSREVRAAMEAHGIRVVVPPGAQAFADLPIVLPEIRGLLRPPEGTISLLDVGGDDVGAKVLSSFRTSLVDGAYDLWQVVNTSRPFTATVEGCLRMRAELEGASRLTVTGFLANTHLIEETTPETVLAGWRVVAEAARVGGLPIPWVTAMGPLARDPALAEITDPLLALERRMLPPWLARRADGHEGCTGGPLPAARPIPIGRPPPIQPGTRSGHGDHQD